MNKWGAYPYHRSPLFRAGNKRKLLNLLQASPKLVKAMLAHPREYYFLKSECINGKDRDIQLPTGNLRRVHERIKLLMERIETRRCVISPKKGMTIKHNALPHLDNTQIRSFDIRKFYPSTTEQHVFRFFLDRLEMKEDIAGLMTKLVTFKGRVPFGSPLSPILCAHVHDDLFEEFERIAEDRGVDVTAWVDDVTLSGPGVPEKVIYEMRGAVAAKGLRSHKVTTQKVRKGAKVTGTVILPGRVQPANEVQLKIKGRLEDLESCNDPQLKIRLLNSLIGLHTHCLQVYEKGSAQHCRVIKRKQWLCEERRKLNGQA